MTTPVTPHTSADKTIAADGFFYVYQGEGKPEVKLTFMALMIELGLYSLQNSRNAFNTQFERAQEKVRCMEDLNKLVQEANTIKTKFPSDAKSDHTADSGLLASRLQEFNRKYPNQAINVSFEPGDTFEYKFDPEKLEAKIQDALNNKEDTEVVLFLLAARSAHANWVDKEGKGTLGELRKIHEKYGPTTGWECIAGHDAGQYEYYVSNGGLQSIISNMQTAQSTLSSENEQQSMRTNQAMNRSSGFLQQLQNMMQAAKESLQAASKAGGS